MVVIGGNMNRNFFYVFVVFLVLQLQFINCGSRINFKALDTNTQVVDLSSNNQMGVLDSGNSPISGSRPLSIVASPGAENNSTVTGNNSSVVVNPSTKNGTFDSGSSGAGGGTSQSCSNSILSFNIYSKVTVTSVYSYSGEFKIDVNQEDLPKKKFAFLAVSTGTSLSLYNFRIGQFVDGSNISNYTDYALALSENRCDYSLKLFDFRNADFSALGGYRVLAGYGVGNTADLAATEMVKTVRYRELLNIPSQPASISFVNMSSATSSLSGSAFVFVSSAHQLKRGYYFLAANSKDGSQWYMYSGGSWIKFDGNNFVSVNGLKELRNVSIPFSADLTNKELDGTKLYAGYAVSDSLAEAFQIFVSNSQNSRNTTPYVIDSVKNQNAMDYLVEAYSSGAVNSYSIYSKMKIAEIHKGKLGFVFGVIQFQDKYYVYNKNINQFVVYDGVLAGFSSATALDTDTSYITFANSINVIPFGGAKLFMGYGVGNTPVVAVNEMLSATRWREIATIPIRPFSGSVTVPNYNKSSSANVEINFKLEVDYKDYGTAGKFYVIVCTADSSTCKVLNGSSWVTYTGGSQDVSLYTSSNSYMDKFNYSYYISGVDLASNSGLYLYVGYGKSISEMLEKKHFSSPTIIP